MDNFGRENFILDLIAVDMAKIASDMDIANTFNTYFCSIAELQNIPESVEQKDLESFLLDLFKSSNLVVSSCDLVAVQRLGKYSPIKSRNVIVRFLNRSKAYFCLKNTKDLNKSSNNVYKRIFITENLCPTNRAIFNCLYKLKKEEKKS